MQFIFVVLCLTRSLVEVSVSCSYNLLCPNIIGQIYAIYLVFGSFDCTSQATPTYMSNV